MDLIPVDEKNKWGTDLKLILNEMNKLSDADKIHGFRNEVVDKYIAHRAFNFVTDQLILVDCEREMLEKEVEELKYKVDNLGNYDENRLKQFTNKTVVVPSSDKEKRVRTNDIFTRLKKMNGSISKQLTNK